MYKCGWQGCEKAYGTLNHLNAHVTMQSHGAKRTPEGKYLNLEVLCRKVAFLVRLRFFGFAFVSDVTQREPCYWRGHYKCICPTLSPRLSPKDFVADVSLVLAHV